MFFSLHVQHVSAVIVHVTLTNIAIKLSGRRNMRKWRWTQCARRRRSNWLWRHISFRLFTFTLYRPTHKHSLCVWGTNERLIFKFLLLFGMSIFTSRRRSLSGWSCRLCWVHTMKLIELVDGCILKVLLCQRKVMFFAVNMIIPRQWTRTVTLAYIAVVLIGVLHAAQESLWSNQERSWGSTCKVNSFFVIKTTTRSLCRRIPQSVQQCFSRSDKTISKWAAHPQTIVSQLLTTGKQITSGIRIMEEQNQHLMQDLQKLKQQQQVCIERTN